MDPGMSWGPSVWYEFHAYARNPPSNQQAIETFYTVTIPAKIECAACLEKYMKLLRRYPIPSNVNLLFEWTVKIHNIVNLMLRKPLVDVEEARLLMV